MFVCENHVSGYGRCEIKVWREPDGYGTGEVTRVRVMPLEVVDPVRPLVDLQECTEMFLRLPRERQQALLAGRPAGVLLSQLLPPPVDAVWDGRAGIPVYDYLAVRARFEGRPEPGPPLPEADAPAIVEVDLQECAEMFLRLPRERQQALPAGFDPPEVGSAFEHAAYASLRWVVYNTLRDLHGRPSPSLPAAVPPIPAPSPDRS